MKDVPLVEIMYLVLPACQVRVTEGDLGLCFCGIFQVLIKQNKQI